MFATTTFVIDFETPSCFVASRLHCTVRFEANDEKREKTTILAILFYSFSYCNFCGNQYKPCMLFIYCYRQLFSHCFKSLKTKFGSLVKLQGFEKVKCRLSTLSFCKAAMLLNNKLEIILVEKSLLRMS